ncbi:MAG: 30S ribosomal protein S20 [Chlamydiota bacterium]
MSTEETPKKIKIATAKKREKQTLKKTLCNRSFKAKAKTARSSLEKACASSAPLDEKRLCLSKVYSLLDKCVKKGIFTKNKAARLKARYASKVA